MWYKIIIQLLSFACEYPTFPTLLVEEIVLLSLYCLRTLVKEDHLTIHTRVYFWLLYPLMLASMFSFMLVLYCLTTTALSYEKAISYHMIFHVIIWNKKMWGLQFSSYSGLFWLFEILWDFIWIKKNFYISGKKCHSGFGMVFRPQITWVVWTF